MRGTGRLPRRGDPLAQTVRDEVTRQAAELLKRRFRPSSERERQARAHGFNHPIEVFGEWRGSSFYLCVRYRTPRGRPAEDFVVRTTRLKHVGRGRFELAYRRHNDRWQPVYSELTVDRCFAAIESEEIFWPST